MAFAVVLTVFPPAAGSTAKLLSGHLVTARAEAATGSHSRSPCPPVTRRRRGPRRGGRGAVWSSSTSFLGRVARPRPASSSGCILNAKELSRQRTDLIAGRLRVELPINPSVSRKDHHQYARARSGPAIDRRTHHHARRAEGAARTGSGPPAGIGPRPTGRVPAAVRVPALEDVQRLRAAATPAVAVNGPRAEPGAAK